MRYLKRFNTIFYKLVVSYIAIIVIVTMVLGITSYAYFSSIFKNEVEKVQERVLENYKNSIETTVIGKIKKIYVEISSSLYPYEDIVYFVEHPIQNNYSKITSMSRLLDSVRTANSNIIESIEIYYRNHEMLISSQYGVKFLKEPGREVYKDTDWLKVLQDSHENTLWMETRPFRTDRENSSEDALIPTTTYVCRFPASLAGTDKYGIIAFNINESMLRTTYKELVMDENGTAFIMGGSGKIVSHIDKDVVGQDFSNKPYARDIINSDKAFGSFIGNVNGKNSMISFTTLDITGWKLVSATPIDTFYKSSDIIRKMLLLICVVAIFIGLLLTGIFTSGIYNPLQSLMSTIRTLFSDEGQYSKKKENEYAYIDHVINNLSVKINGLEDMLKTNQPIIEHNLVLSLFNNNTMTQDELDGYLGMLGISVNQSQFVVVMFELDPEIIQHTNIENRQFIKYNLIKHMVNMVNFEFGSGTLCLAAALSASKIGIIIGLNEQKDKAVRKIINSLINYIKDNFMIPSVVVIGRYVESLLKVHVSSRDVQEILKYKYFLPECRLMAVENLIQREKSTDKIPDTLLVELSDGLKLRNQDLINRFISTFAKMVTEGNYSAAHCHERIVQSLFIISNYIQEMRYEAAGRKMEDFNNHFLRCSNFNQLMELIREFIRDVFEFIKKRNDSYVDEVIEKVKEYIDEHIGEDISLETVADRFSMNYQYFGRLFKNGTGMNYVDFVTKKRLANAKEILLTTDLNVEQVGAKVGFNTPAYFIKKFKQEYGETPKNYKRLHNSGN